MKMEASYEKIENEFGHGEKKMTRVLTIREKVRETRDKRQREIGNQEI